jgi:hypothetical protein
MTAKVVAKLAPTPDEGPQAARARASSSCKDRHAGSSSAARARIKAPAVPSDSLTRPLEQLLSHSGALLRSLRGDSTKPSAKLAAKDVHPTLALGPLNELNAVPRHWLMALFALETGI